MEEKKRWYYFLEVLIDRLVPFAVILLLGVLIIEFFFQDLAETYHTSLGVIDYCILSIFSIDLIFKYLRIRVFSNFIKDCWLDIIAIFPFFLIFRVFESILIFTELPKELRQAQLILHEGVAISESSSKIIREAEESGKISRVKTIIRMFRGVEDSPKIVKALAFYEQPVGKHHLHKIKGKKTFKKIEKRIEKEVQNVEKDVNTIAKKLNKLQKTPRKKK